MIFPGTSAERREGKKEAFMAENKKFVITVGRQYGSGGAEMAKRLGERLGLHVYDKEILKMTSEVSLTFFVYSLLWTRPQMRILVPTPNPEAYLALRPQAMHGI